MKSVATNTHNAPTLPFRGGEYVAQLMAELNRVGIAQRIQAAREQAGLTQPELADALHVHRNTVQNWESQRKPITPWDRLGEIASWTGVTRDWLIHGDHQNLDPQDALRARFVDALQELQSSQEDVHSKLDSALTALERLEGLLSTQRGQQPVQDTAGPDSASIRPQ